MILELDWISGYAQFKGRKNKGPSKEAGHHSSLGLTLLVEEKRPEVTHITHIPHPLVPIFLGIIGLHWHLGSRNT
jgi:hypothetical protein